jgi:hypothetical protein
VNEHPKDSITTVTPAILTAFRTFLEKEKFDFQEDSEKHVGELKRIADNSHYNADILRDIEQLQKALQKEKERGFERYEKEIADELRIELMARLKGEHGRIEASFRTDPQLNAALGLLGNKKEFSRRIGG